MVTFHALPILCFSWWRHGKRTVWTGAESISSCWTLATSTNLFLQTFSTECRKKSGEVIHTMSLHRWMEHWRNISISISISQICSNTWCQRKHPFEPFLFVSCIHVARRILTGAWALDSARPHKPLGKTRGLKHPETTQQPWVEIIIMFSNPNLLANFRFWWMNTSEPLTLVKDGSSSTHVTCKKITQQNVGVGHPQENRTQNLSVDYHIYIESQLLHSNYGMLL